MKQFIHPGKEGQLSFQNNSLVFLAFSITQRLQSSSSGERTVSADGPTYILNKEWPGCPHHLSDFLSILCTLSILSILYTQKPSRRVDSNQCQIFSQIRSEDIHSGPVGLRMSEVEEAPPSAPPTVPRSSFPRPNRPDTLPDFLSDPGPSIGLPCHSSLNGSVVPIAMSYL